ncbi:MAG: IS630 family transposase, partial [Deltaproteobacteria bacterium]|nr:IS630 family transposase [Deltaproteobacteria bacterium]
MKALGRDLRRDPRALGYEQNLWDGKLLSHHLQARYGVALGVRQCQRLFSRLGFRRRKPRPQIAKADPAAQKAFKNLRRLARRDDVDLWFEDECHFQQHGSRCVMWVPPEDKDPTLLHAPTRKNVGIIGAVRPADGKLVTSPAKVFDEISFLEFLMALLPHRRRGRRMIVVLDNRPLASLHRLGAGLPWSTANEYGLSFCRPPVSPELNPIERV